MGRNKQDLGALFGEPGRAEYRVGDQVTFLESGQELTGEIIYIQAPGETVTGRKHPAQLQVDAGDGFPHIVYQSDIVAR